jgi:AbiV family abortive infection protein
MKRLTSQQMAEVALEALKNARRLYDDAMILRIGDRLPSALMVAGLAADELGKHILVSSFYIRDQTEDEWRNFWKRFRRHEAKLDDALLSAWAGDLLSEDPPPDAAAFHQERLLATYVDVSDDGAVSTPSEVVVQQRVDKFLAMLKRGLEYCESVIARTTPLRFAAVLESMRTSTPEPEIRQVLDEGGPEALMAFVIGVRAGMPHDRALSFAQEANNILGPRGLDSSGQ